MKIFWIKQGPLLPLDSGGKIRTWNILQQLGKQNEITALSFFPTHMLAEHDKVERHLKRLIEMPVEMPAKYSLRYRLDYLCRLPSSVPYVVRQYGIPQVRDRAVKLLERESFDVLVCDFLFPCLNLPDSAPCPQVLFAHNAETLIWKRHFEVSRNLVWKLITGLEQSKMRGFEIQRARAFDHVITVSDSDYGFFRRGVPASKLSVLSTGVDIEYFSPSTVPENPRKLVFTGSMDWLANEDAILYFAEKVLPLIRKIYPDVTLTVAGRDPTEKLRRLAKSNPHIQLTGTVADVRPYIGEAAVYVLPLRIGSGTRLKAFEAMAMAKAMVSTHVGVEGLPVVPGQHLLVADKPEEFAAAVAGLIQDVPTRRRIGTAARRLVEGNYGWPQVACSFQNILERVVERDVQQSAGSTPARTSEYAVGR